ncbi:hypothetical protein, partial [Escherichia coli]|uniref:hypothetical protein n=1 Tax=Escherichia coli TaxID=562 RepID=UPI00195FF8AF
EIPTNLINLKNLLKQYELQGFGSKKTFPSKRLFILYFVPAFFSIAQILFAIFFSFQGGKNYEPLKFGKLVFTSLILFLPLCFLYLFASYRVLARYP